MLPAAATFLIRLTADPGPLPDRDQKDCHIRQRDKRPLQIWVRHVGLVCGSGMWVWYMGVVCGSGMQVWYMGVAATGRWGWNRHAFTPR